MIKKLNKLSLQWKGDKMMNVKFSMFEFHDASLAFVRREIPKHLAA
jgi:hypothetical protein